MTGKHQLFGSLEDVWKTSCIVFGKNSVGIESAKIRQMKPEGIVTTFGVVEVAPGYTATTTCPQGADFIRVQTKFLGSIAGHDHGGDSNSEGPYNNNIPRWFDVLEGQSRTDTFGPASGRFGALVMVHAKNGQIGWASAFWDIKIPGLEHIGASADYVLIGSTENHKSNHYGLPSTNDALRKIAAEYKGATGTPLYFNDMSLMWGGLFDINGNYSAPHAEHRNGNVIDIAATPETLLNEAQLVKLLTKYAKNYILEGNGSNRHYHVRF